jgi:uncharacterized membrane protein YhaH (DUF805 family)
MPVARVPYATTGIGLFACKYLVDAAIVRAIAHQSWTPASYLNPSLSVRQFLFTSSPPWLAWGLGVWTLPFLWIGVSMTVRRAAHAGLPPWTGLIFFVPALNYVWMLFLCVLPSASRRATRAPHPPRASFPFGRALVSAAAGIIVGVAMVAVSTLWLRDYGFALFVGTPFVMGFLAGFTHNVPTPRSARETFWVVQLTFVIAGGAILLAALEGLLCLFMAYPLAAVIGALGGVLGRTTAVQSQMSIVHGVLLAMTPAALVTLDSGARPGARVVTTVVEIDASPAVVWDHVVSVAELSPPHQWVFRLGIAYPMRARLTGHGVGAVRRCEFSTGPFVEPITTWEEPRLLAFDVIEQPPVLDEWSPYQGVAPPHLLSALRVERGEFRLFELPGRRTRLVGRTWYTLDIFPQVYWAPMATFVLHRVHQRVLSHIQKLSESDAIGGGF